MEQSAERFICLEDPAGKWTVFDLVGDEPAQIGGCPLIFRPKQRAESAREILERIYGKRLERQYARAA